MEIFYRLNAATRDVLIAYFKDMYANGEIRAVTDFPPYVDKLMANAEIFEAWGGGLMGFCAVYCNRRERDFAFVPQINVAASLRGTGVAQELMREVIVQTTRLGFKVLRLYANKTNARARAFYRKMGFNETIETEKQILFEYQLGANHDRM